MFNSVYSLPNLQSYLRITVIPIKTRRYHINLYIGELKIRYLHTWHTLINSSLSWINSWLARFSIQICRGWNDPFFHPRSLCSYERSRPRGHYIISCLIINAHGPIITVRRSGYAKEESRDELVSDNDCSVAIDRVWRIIKMTLWDSFRYALDCPVISMWRRNRR